jgi:phytoene dehydrogenase-like protein
VAVCRDLLDRIRFGAQVERATWDPARARWHVVTAAGERFTARFLVGALHYPVLPALPGTRPSRRLPQLVPRPHAVAATPILWTDTSVAFWRRTRHARLSDYQTGRAEVLD